MTALKMTVDEALALADQWCAGLTMDADSKGWGAILLVLAEEVRRLRADARRLDWIEAAADARKIEIARSLYGTGYEIGEWPSMCVSVTSGSLRAAIDAAMEASNAG